MRQKHKLWKVTYSFFIPTDYADYREKVSYLVVGKNKAEAEDKGDGIFLESDFCEYLNFNKSEIGNLVRRMITKKSPIKIPFPNLSGSYDKEKYILMPKVTNDGSHIYFEVRRK